MSMECLSCTAETDGVALCARCRITVTAALVNTAAYYGDVESIQPGQRVKARSAYRSTPPTTLDPGSIDAIDAAISATDNTVTGWVRVLLDQRTPEAPKATSTPALCGWLEAHLGTIVTLDWCAEFLRDMRACERALQRLLDRSDTGMFAGVCDNEIGREVTEDGDVETVTCPRPLYRTTSLSWVRCPECGRTWQTEERRTKMLAAARDEHAPVSVIARAVVGLVDHEHSVARLANRIDMWVKREKLQSMGVRVLADGKPHRVYRIGDVFDLMGMESKTDDDEAC